VVPGGFSHREGCLGGGSIQDSGEVAASPGSKSGEEATYASEEMFPPSYRALARLRELSGDAGSRRWAWLGDSALMGLSRVVSCENGKEVEGWCSRRHQLSTSLNDLKVRS
jgi:hypothetical protein